MADNQQTKVCEACGEPVTYTGHKGYKDAHRGCALRGKNAVDSTHPACPAHSTLVWAVGPYSTFRTCHSWCTAGKDGKPYRFCAPRGAVVAKAPTPAPQYDSDDDQTDQKEDNSDMQPPIAPPLPPANGAINLKALGTLGDAIQGYVDSRATQLASEMIAAALKDAKVGGPSVVEWTVNAEPFAKIEGAHHTALPRLLKLVAAGFRNFLIVGPAGSGKTTLARDLAKALTRAYASISCTSGMSESSLTGRAIPNLATGDVVYQSTQFVATYEGGGVFLIDEVDAADPNVMLVINSALANGHMPLPNRTEAPTAERHDDSIIICAANTWGTGADRQYVGRNQLDAAFLDRFVGATIEVNYDRELESSLVGDANICARVWTIRDKVMDLKLRRVVGTRFLLSVARLVRAAGETLDASLTACTTGWTQDERSKVGVRS